MKCNKTTYAAIQRLERIREMIWHIDDNNSVKMSLEQVAKLEKVYNDLCDLIKSMRADSV